MRAPYRFLGFFLLVVCIGGIALSSYLNSVTAKPGDEPTILGVLWLSSFVGFPAVGAVIVWKLPRNQIGWMLAGIGASIGVLAFTGTYANYALLIDSAAPG